MGRPYASILIMKLNQNLLLRVIVIQILFVCFMQVTTPLQKMLMAPALIFFIFTLIKNRFSNIFEPLQRNLHIVHKFIVLFVFSFLSLNIFFASDKNILKQIMFGWDFVGHFGVFRWGLNHINMFTSAESNPGNVIESYLDSNYPQTWALLGANFFRWLPQDSFIIMRALLFFSVCTLVIAYLIFFSTYKEFDLLSKAALHGPHGNKLGQNTQRGLDLIFVFVLISFISFCWNTNCPHFALSTSLIFRATILSQNSSQAKSNNFEAPFLIFAAFILYPLTMIFSGVYFYNYFRENFKHEFSIKKVLFSFESFLNLSILVAALGLIFIKADRSVKLSTLIFSYGGVTFPSFVFVAVILLIILVSAYLHINYNQILQLLCLSLPVLLLDLLLIIRNGEVSYYGAKSTIAFIVILLGLFMTFLVNRNFNFKYSKPMTATLAVILIVLGSIYFDKAQPVIDDINKRGIPMSIKRAFDNYELPKGWQNSNSVLREVKKNQSDSNYMPLFTGDYPYLANMWLALLGKYPSEIFTGNGDLISGQLPIVLDYTNPIAYLSRNLNKDELERFEQTYPYITVVKVNE